MTNNIENHEESGSVVSDYFYFENGYYHRVRANESRERTQTPVLVAA